VPPDYNMSMTFESVVQNGRISLPPGVEVPEGTPVRVEITAPKRFEDLLELAGSWSGDDAERVVADIYARRSSAPARAGLDP
jgi:hypothetical protein